MKSLPVEISSQKGRLALKRSVIAPRALRFPKSERAQSKKHELLGLCTRACVHACSSGIAENYRALCLVYDASRVKGCAHAWSHVLMHVAHVPRAMREQQRSAQATKCLKKVKVEPRNREMFSLV